MSLMKRGEDNMLEKDKYQTNRRKTFNFMLIMLFILQLILPIGVHANAMGGGEEGEEPVTVQVQEAEEFESEQEAEEAKEVEEAEDAAKKAEEEAARKAEEEAARKAEAEAARKAEEEEAARKVEETKKAEKEKAEKEENETKKDKKPQEEKKEVKEDKEKDSANVETEKEKEKITEKEEKDESEELEKSSEDVEEEEIESDLAEDVRATRHLTFPVPLLLRKLAMSSGGSDGFVEVKKTAERTKEFLEKCRTFLVNLEITGEAPSTPVDVVLILDKSGSMNEKTPITSAPVAGSGNKYFVRVGSSFSDYREVSHHSGNTWKYSVSGWGGNYRYVYWDPNGNDTASGGNSSNPRGKPFYFEETRMDSAKEASVNFAGKVLNEAPAGSRVSVVEFSGPEYTNGYGNQNQAQTSIPLTNNITTITNAINNITAVGGTNTEAGFLQGRDVIENSGNPNSKKVVIMFTDGLPTASNGNQYNETTNPNHIHMTRAVAAGTGIFNDDVADVFTVGLLQGMSSAERNLALNILGQTNNSGFYEAPTAADLDQIFADIAEKINYFGKDGVVVDKIGDNFNLIESTLPQGATYNSSTREITWNVGQMASKKTLSYVVQAKPGFPGGQAYTNEYATLTYTDPFGNTGLTKTFDKPEVDIPTLIEVSLTDATINLGDSINLGSGTDATGENYMSPVTGGDNDGVNFTYEWRKVGDSNVFSTEENPEVSPTEDSEYELTVIDSNGCIAITTMTVTVNKNIGKISIKKLIKDLDKVAALTFFGDVDPSIFENIEFEIKVNGPNGYERIVELTHDDTEMLEELAFGQYSIKEINIDDRFLLDNINPTSFELTKDNQFVEVSVLNKLNFANFEFTKVDEEGAPLENIEFELTKGDVSQTVTTDENGKVSFNFLETGEYKLRETKTVAGFKLPTETWMIEVVRNAETGELEINIPDDSFLVADPVKGNTIKNEAQSEFPKTGGVGGLTYIASGLAILTTSLGLFVKKKKNKNKKEE